MQIPGPALDERSFGPGRKGLRNRGSRVGAVHIELFVGMIEADLGPVLFVGVNAQTEDLRVARTEAQLEFHGGLCVDQPGFCHRGKEAPAQWLGRKLSQWCDYGFLGERDPSLIMYGCETPCERHLPPPRGGRKLIGILPIVHPSNQGRLLSCWKMVVADRAIAVLSIIGPPVGARFCALCECRSIEAADEELLARASL